jgi:hypothetical protein
VKCVGDALPLRKPRSAGGINRVWTDDHSLASAGALVRVNSATAVLESKEEGFDILPVNRAVLVDVGAAGAVLEVDEEGLDV